MKKGKLVITLTITITLLLLAGSTFYWYEWRPTQIREKCWKESLKENDKGGNMIIQSYFDDPAIPNEKKEKLMTAIDAGQNHNEIAEMISQKYGDKYGISGSPISFETCLKIFGISE